MSQPSFFSRLKLAIVMQLGIWIFLILRWTMRFKVVGAQHRKKAAEMGPNGSHIIIIWHENSFSSVSGHAYQKLVPMISLSKDGEAISRVCVKLGYQPPVRGSSSKGAANVKTEMANALLDGAVGAITVDGPRGPLRKVKYGAIRIASETGAPILPNVCRSKNPWILRSWDRSRLPKPFSKIEIVYGEPIHIPKDLDKEGVIKYAEIVEAKLNELEYAVNPDLNVGVAKLASAK